VSFTQDLFTQRRNYQDGNVRIGQLDRIWYDEHRNAFYIGDGTTPGGRLIGGGGGWCGSFFDTTTQTISNVSLGYTVGINSTTVSDGVSIDNNEIVFAYSGKYEITFSLQFENSDNTRQNIDIWFQKNGVNIPDSNSQFSVANNTAGKLGKLIAVTPFLDEFVSGDRITLKWRADDVAVRLVTLAAYDGVPRTPGVIVTVKQV
jgi:hypothetical protein